MTRHGGDGRLDLEPYVYPYDEDWYPMPSKMLLVADPVLIPDEMLEVLLTWNGDGECMAMVTDRSIDRVASHGRRHIVIGAADPDECARSQARTSPRV